MPTTPATILTHKLKNPDFTATATDSAAWMPLAEIQKTEKDWEGTVSSSYQLLFSGNLKNDSVTLDNLQPKYAASNYYKNNIPTSSPDQDLTHYLTIPDSAITEGTIASNAVTARTITAAAVTAGAIATAAVTAGAIAENQIYNRHIASIGEGTDGIDGQKIQNSSLTLNKIDTKLKGILINSVNPDNMIINFSPGQYPIFFNDENKLSLSSHIMEVEDEENIWYEGKAFFEGTDIFKLEIDENNNFSFSLNPITVIIFKTNDENTVLKQYSFQYDPILINNKNQDFKIPSINELRVKPLQWVHSAIGEFIFQIKDIDISSTDFENLDFKQNDWSSFLSPTNSLFFTPLYSSREEFENTMCLSQDDYDKLGIWIKI